MTSDQELGDRLRRAFEVESPPRITAPHIRESAERLLADVYDVVVLLVGAYANKILPQLLPHLSYTLPSDVVDRHLSKLSIVHDTIMAWAAEALERAGVPQPHRPAAEAVPVFEFERLIELGRQDAEVRTSLADAEQSVGEAARQLAAISPDDRDGQVKARLALGQAIGGLIAASAHLMRLDAEDRAARLNEGRQERMRQPSPNRVIKAPLRPTGSTERPPSPRLLPGQRFPYDVRPYLTKQRPGNPAPNPASNEGGAGAAPSR